MPLSENDRQQDEELQAVLALSSRAYQTDTDQLGTVHASTLAPHESLAARTSPTVLQEIWLQKEPFHTASFHDIMWDLGTTTENDKARWVSEAIQWSPVAVENGEFSGLSTPDATMLSVLVQSEHPPWGLAQHFGGPCGVLAAVQAEALRILIWGKRLSCSSDGTTHDLECPTTPEQLLSAAPLDDQSIRVAIARAIATILVRAALQTPVSTANCVNTTEQGPVTAAGEKCVRVVLPMRKIGGAGSKADATGPAVTWTDLEPWDSSDGASFTTASQQDNRCRLATYTIHGNQDLEDVTYKRQKKESELVVCARAQENREDNAGVFKSECGSLARIVGDFLLYSFSESIAPVDYFCREGGIMLLVMSLVASRGKQTIESEFDDPSTKLTAQFGHSSQELLNLLLTGQAVSNVFDNNLSPDRSLICRGIQQQSDIGYLSQLEALRYCQVGSYYKTPVFPIWVIGSQSHFTVMFGDDKSLKESQSDMLLEKCRRAFKAIEGGEDNGFISSEKLSAVFGSLNLNLNEAIPTIAATIEVPGAGIILWSDFWRVTSRLMTGANVETVLRGPQSTDHIQPLPPTVSEVSGKNATDTLSGRITAVNYETDEEMARRVDMELNSERTVQSECLKTAPQELNDEELARILQAEWDAELQVLGASDRASARSPSTLSDYGSTLQRQASSPTSTHDPQWTSKSTPSDTALDRYGDSFTLYHYNGLRSGKLTPFCVTRLGAEEAVGASTALNHASGDNSGGLDEVVRTKWPSCMINWMGQSSPMID